MDVLIPELGVGLDHGRVPVGMYEVVQSYTDKGMHMMRLRDLDVGNRILFFVSGIEGSGEMSWFPAHTV